MLLSLVACENQSFKNKQNYLRGINTGSINQKLNMKELTSFLEKKSETDKYKSNKKNFIQKGENEVPTNNEKETQTVAKKDFSTNVFKRLEQDSLKIINRPLPVASGIPDSFKPVEMVKELSVAGKADLKKHELFNK